MSGVSNFDQIPLAKERRLVLGIPGALRCPMPITNQFWQYAREALLLAYEAKTDDDKQALLDLAETWTLAALEQRRSQVDDDKAIAA